MPSAAWSTARTRGVISNLVVGEGDADIANPQGLSGMMYAWGQFIDHDINLTADSRTATPIFITIPPTIRPSPEAASSR